MLCPLSLHLTPPLWLYCCYPSGMLSCSSDVDISAYSVFVFLVHLCTMTMNGFRSDTRRVTSIKKISTALTYQGQEIAFLNTLCY